MPFRIKDRLRSFPYAFRGLGVLVSTQANARVHLAASISVVALGAFSHLVSTEWIALIVAIALVWVAEALNTSLEFLADEVSLARKPLIRNAKDLGAAAVLLACLAAVAIGAIVFLPHLRRL